MIDSSIKKSMNHLRWKWSDSSRNLYLLILKNQTCPRMFRPFTAFYPFLALRISEERSGILPCRFVPLAGIDIANGFQVCKMGYR